MMNRKLLASVKVLALEQENAELKAEVERLKFRLKNDSRG